MRMLACVTTMILANAAAFAAPEPVVLYDFTQGDHGWTAAHAVSPLQVTEEGIAFACIGEDPYVWGPPVEDMPLGNRVLLTIRMKSDGDGGGQVFFGPSFSAERSANFSILNDGEWHEYAVLLPVQEAGTRLRIDPAGSEGNITIAWIKALEMKPLMKTEFTAPASPDMGPEPLTVRSGRVVIAHGGRAWGGFTVTVSGGKMAAAHAQARIGVMDGEDPVYLDLAQAPLKVSPDGEALEVSASVTGPRGAAWTLTRRFAPGETPNAVDVTTTVVVDRDSQVFHLPMLTLFPGLDAYGTVKTQAVLPGVEYLSDEPSSSEADVRGPNANRRIVDDYKLCFPMMGIVAEERYLGLAWDRDDHPAPVFDSPDRVFGSGAHLMGLWYPAVGPCRLENEFDIFLPFDMKAGEAKVLKATIFGGEGATVNAPVMHYVGLAGGLPELPEFEDGLQDAINLLAHGWLDSALHEDGTWRHAVWGSSFPAGPVTDAPGYMTWLAEHTDDAALAGRLRAGAARGLERAAQAGAWNGSCSHVARPFNALIFGDLESNVADRVRRAWQNLGAFDEGGLVRYKPRPDGNDYGSTHWTDHANGLSAVQLEPVLEAAALSGDDDLAEQALEVLDLQIAAYANTVPRGAQTWEMPLHTPDILASGRMLRNCTLGYLLTGDAKYLDAGRYWAWTGVSMIYLDPPTAGDTGLYATTAVLGATAWAAPYWIGQPVQWCGLVYRSALEDFAQVDPERGPFWAQLARGITISGLQQTFPLDDDERQGLLPDFFYLKDQKSDGPAISPGTVQANLAEVYGVTPIYTARRLGDGGMIAHVPGGIGDASVTDQAITLDIDGWYPDAYWVRITRVPAAPAGVTLSGGEVLALDYSDDQRVLNVRLAGEGTLNIER